MQKLFLLLFLILTSCSALSGMQIGDSFPIYGRWCGPGHPKEYENPKPIDYMDQICKKHDICYREEGYFNKACDQALIAELEELNNDELDFFQKATRDNIISYFKMQLRI